MSIRLRLALWYGALLALILLFLTAFSYAFHARGHYDDLDRALVTTADHTADELLHSSVAPRLVEGSGGFRVILRLYRSDGALVQSSAGASGAPTVDPRRILARPAGPAFDPVAGMAPPIMPVSAPAGSVFGLATRSSGRWRIYVLPIAHGSVPSAEDITYVQALVPLDDLDQSMGIFRLLLTGLALVGLLGALFGSWLVAGTALRPITRIIEAAQNITRSRDLSQRLARPRHHDELGQLTWTFNAMLASIEGAYAAQQRFVSDAAHELRAPLTAIQANLDLMGRHPEMTNTDRGEALGEAEREAERLTRLVADLLALARADAGLPLRSTLVDLDVVVLEVVGNARQLSHGQAITLDALEPLQVRGDEDRLKQLLLILFDNALKYTPASGAIAVDLHRSDQETVVMVRDTGVGISPEDLPHIFERFYRADPARGRDPGGTGLGLSIAQWIVQQHGGQIAVTSTPGVGTTVAVRLPIADLS